MVLLYTNLSIYLFINGSTVLLFDLGRFSISQSHIQSVRLLGRGISPSQSRYLHTEQHKHKINSDIRALSGIRTHDPSVRATEEGLCCRPRRDCDGHKRMTLVQLVL
jgi:hypothetical protein